jgi:methionyl-tRNA formyltransferase
LTLRKDIKKDSLRQEEVLKKSIRELCEENEIPLGYFDNINHPDFVEVLSLIQPDLIVLGGAPIIKKPVIEIPRIGILNSHPGLLPAAKGMDVVAHSILDNLPLGVTVFKIDGGIDSGPILLTRYLDFNVKGRKLNEIEAMVENLSAKTMLEALELLNKGTVDFVSQQGGGMLYKSLDYKEYRKVKSILKSH